MKIRGAAARLPELKGNTMNPLAVWDLNVYVRGDREMACYRLPGEIPQVASIRQEPCD